MHLVAKSNSGPAASCPHNTFGLTLGASGSVCMELRIEAAELHPIFFKVPSNVGLFGTSDERCCFQQPVVTFVDSCEPWPDYHGNSRPCSSASVYQC